MDNARTDSGGIATKMKTDRRVEKRERERGERRRKADIEEETSGKRKGRRNKENR